MFVRFKELSQLSEFVSSPQKIPISECGGSRTALLAYSVRPYLNSKMPYRCNDIKCYLSPVLTEYSVCRRCLKYRKWMLNRKYQKMEVQKLKASGTPYKWENVDGHFVIKPEY